MALLICEECGRIDDHHPNCPNNGDDDDDFELEEY